MKTATSLVRLSPRPEPWPESIAKLLETYPRGRDGLIRLFRTLAHSERTLGRMGYGMVLDKGSPLTIKHREILILKVSALCNCPYEWGIHIKAFGKVSGLSDAQNKDTAKPQPNPELWSDDEHLLLTVAEQIHRDNTVDDEAWRAMQATWDTEQIMEIIFICGFYHTIAYFNNALQIEQEEGAPVFDDDF